MAKRAKQKAAAKATVRVTLVRSTIGFNKNQAVVANGLGLRRIGQSVEVVDHPAMRGMIQKIRHLVRVEG